MFWLKVRDHILEIDKDLLNKPDVQAMKFWAKYKDNNYNFKTFSAMLLFILELQTTLGPTVPGFEHWL